MKRKRDEPFEEDEPLSTELAERENVLLETYRTAIRDVRYILNKYRALHPDEAWETIQKIVYDKKLK